MQIAMSLSAMTIFYAGECPLDRDLPMTYPETAPLEVIYATVFLYRSVATMFHQTLVLKHVSADSWAGQPLRDT
jgi:hypothetical protein